jgi:hypothetical protein
VSATAPTARRAASSTEMKGLARWGLAARATIYLLIGVLAALLAAGQYGHEADQRGALQTLAGRSGGNVLIWIIMVGLVGYALWRFSEAAFGVVGEGRKAGPRVQSLVRGCIYLFFAASAFNVVTHASSQSQAGEQQQWTAKVMTHPGGRWVVGIVGVIVVVCGLALVVEGLTRKFEKYLAMNQMSPSTRRLVEVLGVVGTIARGIVFALAGVFVVQAAWDYNASKARGLDGALRSVATASGGRWILGLIALGLIAFGVYGFAEAKWRRT